MDKYYILADKVHSKRQIVLSSELKISDGEMYTSLFYYNDEILKYTSENDTVSGFNGNVYSDYFILDLDGNCLEELIKDIKEFMDWLSSQKCIYYVFFSGNKGFHVYISKHNISYPEEYGWNELLKMFALQIGEKFPQLKKYIDLSIYDKVRIFRFPYSIHQTTGNEKALTEWITFDSDAPMKSFVKNYRNQEDVLKELFITPIYDGDKIFTITDIKSDRTDLKKDSSYFEYVYGEPYCITKILNTRNVDGWRHKVGLRLLGYWHGKGYTEEFARVLLETWNKNIDNSLEKDEINNLMKYYSVGYKFPCVDEVKSKYCLPSCQFFKRRELDESNIFTSEDYYPRYLKDKNASSDHWIYLGHKYDNWHLPAIKPGYVVVVAGGPGSGKTTFMLNIMEFFKHINWLYFSLEMTGENLVEMMLKMKEVDTTNSMAINSFTGDMNHIITIDKPDINVDELANYISMINSSHAKINAIIIDYLSLLQSKGMSQTERTINISKVLKIIAKKLKIAVFVISQVPKEAAGDSNLPLGLNDPKDSGEVVSLADMLFTCWRPNIVGRDDDDTFVVAVPKNRHGPVGYRINLNFCGAKYQIT